MFSQILNKFNKKSCVFGVKMSPLNKFICSSIGINIGMGVGYFGYQVTKYIVNSYIDNYNKKKLELKKDLIDTEIDTYSLQDSEVSTNIKSTLITDLFCFSTMIVADVIMTVKLHDVCNQFISYCFKPVANQTCCNYIRKGIFVTRYTGGVSLLLMINILMYDITMALGMAIFDTKY